VKKHVALFLLAVTLTACGNNTSPTNQTDAAAASTKAPDASAALDAVRKTSEAQATYFKINRRFALTYDELIEARLLNGEPTAAQTGYDFKLRPTADAQTYKLVVVPSDPTATSAQYFFTDQSGAIRAETGKEATADSPEVK
jgi:hypothetical protein